jgi:hypothetical protein
LANIKEANKTKEASEKMRLVAMWANAVHFKMVLLTSKVVAVWTGCTVPMVKNTDLVPILFESLSITHLSWKK